MKWGIMFSSRGFPDPDATIALTQRAEQVECESLWAPERAIMSKDANATPYRGSSDGKMERLSQRGGIPDPLIWFAFAAAPTQQIRFGTGVLVLPEHQPVMLAKAAAMFDHLSGGRLLLGFGVGELPEEYQAVGAYFSNRGQRMDEYFDAMRTLWRDDIASLNGQHVRFDQVECRPWPVRRSIPMLIGGASNAAVRRAAAHGDGYFPFVFPGQDPAVELPRLLNRVRREMLSFGRDPAKMEFTSGGARSLDEAKRFVHFGIHRLTVAIRARSIADMHDEVARLGDELVRPTADL